MKKEFTGTSTVESVSDNLNNEDLACDLAGGLPFFWYDFFSGFIKYGILREFCFDLITASAPL